MIKKIGFLEYKQMERSRFYSYSWTIDEDQEYTTSIRVYGLDSKNKTVCLRIDNFTPYIYLELPTDVKWTAGKAQMLCNKLDKMLLENKPIKKSLIYKHRLYGANIDEKERKKVFPYLFMAFSTKKDIKRLSYRIRGKINVIGLGYIKLKMHEQSASPILQLTCLRDIQLAGWTEFVGKRITGENMITSCDKEYKVKWKNTKPVKSDLVTNPLILGFDIEVNSTNPSAMPKAEKPGDKVFQISCILYRNEGYKKYLLSLGNPDQKKTGKDVIIQRFDTESDLLVGFTTFVKEHKPNVIVGYNILGFDIPYMIDRAKLNLCIYDFDQLGFVKYAHAKERTIKWSSSAYKDQEFQYLDAEGRLFVDLLPLVRRDYKLGNYKLKTVSTFFLGKTKDPLSPQGIFKCYGIGMKGGRKGSVALGVSGKYCIQDGVLVIDLFKKLQTWIGLCEMAKTCCVPIFFLYTQGQQIKVYSQLYKYCTQNNIVVEKDAYIAKDNEHYVGAKVFDPKPGVYDKVLPFDFASLYPTTIIAYNIDYSTWVTDPNIPDSKCHVMTWEDHISCEHDPNIIRKTELTVYIDKEKAEIKKMKDVRNKSLCRLTKLRYKRQIDQKLLELKPYVEERSALAKKKNKYTMCDKRYFRFLKEPRGVMPTVLQTLLDARAHTRFQIKILKKIISCEKPELKEVENMMSDVILEKARRGEALEEKELNTLETLIVVLNKRQLAFKVSANSMYGIMGMNKGLLPFMPGAMCTTAMGRKNIRKVADVIVKKYKGELIYGDSVTEDTPVLCRIDGKICYRTIDDLPREEWVEYKNDKQEAKPLDIEVWTENGFTQIKRIIRHKTKKDIFRVLTHTGIVDVTEDHGLLDEKAVKVSPKNLSVGDRLLTSVLPEIKEYKCDIGEDLAFVVGLMYADGSCGIYHCPSGQKATWAINNQDIKLLEKCQKILDDTYKHLEFKIMDTMESSHVYKLVPRGIGVADFVRKWRSMLYDKRKYKKVPDSILNSPAIIRQSFLDGYYAGDGDKDKNGYFRFDNKGKIGAAALYCLASSLGYKVSINIQKDKMDIYRMMCTKNKQRKKEDKIKKIWQLGKTEKYVYDLETENHHFSAGVGKLIVHNTDSNYVLFPHLDKANEIWDYAEYVASEITKLFPPPIKLEFESVIYWRFLILTKKRYMSLSCGRDGKVSDKISKKGVLLARRDNSAFIRKIYEEVNMMIFYRKSREEILNFIIDELNKLFSGYFSYKDFTMTKSVGNTGGLQPVPFINEKNQKRCKIGSYTVTPLSEKAKERERQFKLKNCTTSREYYLRCLPAQVQLAEKMKKRGFRVDAGSRLEYVVLLQGGHNKKQYEKIEDCAYFAKHRAVLKLDHFYYLKALTNPMDQVLNVIYGGENNKGHKYKFKKDFVLNQYKYRFKIREKVLNELKALFAPKLVFKD